MINKTENQPYVYPLKSPRRKYIRISKNDPRNTPKGLAQLRSFYDYVYVVEDHELLNAPTFKADELTTIQNLSLENNSSATILGQPDTAVPGVSTPSVPITKSIPANAKVPTLLPPVNLSVSTTNVYAPNGTLTISADISFDSFIDNSIADDFEVILTEQKPNFPGAVTGLAKTTGTTITWNVVTSATNYIVQIPGKAPINVVAPAASTTKATKTLSGVSGATSVTVTPYNLNGIAGTAQTATITF